ncbi:hypothetical protein BJX63DRAFT_393367 [Aspergillus granulosus]|uniref:Uncharacterized protein n=1 Tax=Aspergillus granulosus TaxID=176169 RepID=A0ABR4HEB7_9EURO
MPQSRRSSSSSDEGINDSITLDGQKEKANLSQQELNTPARATGGLGDTHPNRRLSEATRRVFARKFHEMGSKEPEELLLL